MFTTTILVIAFALTAFSANTPPTTAGPIDYDLYSGQWFQIYSYPSKFEFGCSKCVTANYIPVDGLRAFKVLNSANNIFGTFSGCQARGLLNFTEEPSQFNFQNELFNTGKYFGNAEYWILAVGPINEDQEYSWAVVSDSRRESLFILSRLNNLDSITLGGIFDFVEKEGFNVDHLVETQQNGCKYVSSEADILK